MKTRFSILALQALTLLTLCLYLSSEAQATTAVMLTDEELITSSRVILLGDVLSTRSQRDPKQEQIYTYIQLQVVSVLKGRLRSDKIIVRQLGGQVGDEVALVFGTPEFKLGQRVLLFLDSDANGILRTAHLFQGKYDVVTDERTGEAFVERKVDAGAVHIVGENRSAEVTNRASLSAFTSKIRNTLRVHAAEAAAYEERFKGRPVVETPSEYAGPNNGSGGKDGGVSTYFALTGNGFRWTEPDVGNVVLYWINPSSPSPVGGDGLNEVNQGFAAWNDVPTSSIRLQFNSYVFNAYGISRDSYNLISYNDPRDQIQDPVNCSGTLALSQLVYTTNEISYASGRAFNRIREADIVFNRNFECFLGNSANFAEVSCHETGHTIGFAHSDLATRAPGDDPIMRSVAHGNGRGARLGFDDVLGATYVYPMPGNPIDDARYFVGWHYRDILDREPDFSGWDFWTSQITQCGSDPTCIYNYRIHVARAFFYSGEFISMNPRLADANRGTPDYNQAFVEQCYLRYWKRPIDSSYWVDYLNNNRPNNDGHYNTVLEAFITDYQYRSRFGYEPVSCDPVQEQSCYDQGGSWDSGTCSCTYNPCGGWGGYCY